MKAVVTLLALVACMNAQANTEKDIQRVADRLAALQSSGVRGDHYFSAKARAWLDLARDAYYQNDRSGVVKESINEADALVRRLASRDIDMPTQTTVVPTAQRIREDLWQKAEQLKTHKDFACAQALTARFEVQLVAAGNANRQLGWRYAKPYMQAAERLVAEAQEQMVLCSARAEPVAAWQSESVQNAAVVDSIQFAATSTDVDEANALKLEKVSHEMRAKRSLRADLAHDQSDKLGPARAEAVRDYLVDTGIGTERIGIRPDAVSANDQVKVTTIDRGNNAAVGNNPSSAYTR